MTELKTRPRPKQITVYPDSEEERQTIIDAAKCSKQNVSAYMLTAALQRAKEVHSDQV